MLHRDTFNRVLAIFRAAIREFHWHEGTSTVGDIGLHGAVINLVLVVVFVVAKADASAVCYG